MGYIYKQHKINIMKKLLLVVVAITFSLAGFSQSGRTVMSLPATSAKLSKAIPAVSAPVMKQGKVLFAEATRYIMGAYTSDNYTTDGLGYGTNIDLKVAQVFPVELMEAYNGGKITGMRFALCNNKGKASNAFIAPVDKEGNILDPVLSKDIDFQQAGWCEVEFDGSYTINTDEVSALLIGYAFRNVNGGYQMSFVNEGTIVKTYVYGALGTNGATDWYDMGAEQYGNLSAQAYVEDLNIADNALSVSSVEPTYMAVNNSALAKVNIVGAGKNAVTTVDYTVAVNGVEKYSGTATLSEPVEFAKSGSFEAEIPAETELGQKTLTITVTKVNGTDITPPLAVENNLYVMSRIAPRGIVVEEYTGTGCQFCPRGWVGMEKLRATFGDSFIGIAIHRYNNSDPMYPSSYANLQFTGAPQCMINRGSAMDPYYGTTDDICKDFQKALDIPTKVGLEITGEYNEDGTKVVANATIEALADGGPYSVEYVLIADGLEGETSAWRQTNAYASYNASQQPEDMAIFCRGGEYGQQYAYIPFNDVAIASSYSGTRNTAAPTGAMTAGETVNSTFTLAMPVKAVLKNAIKLDKVAVAILVINSNGTIENGAKYYLQPSEELLGISDLNQTTSTKEVARYALDGRQLSRAERGINIVRLANGEVVKVLVK